VTLTPGTGGLGSGLLVGVGGFASGGGVNTLALFFLAHAPGGDRSEL
jgi:hypothetical protein